MDLTDVDLTRSETVLVDAPPGRVWDLVTDIGRTGEWSPVCTTCTWDTPPDPERKPAGPRVGDRFTGQNQTPDRTWETHSTVVSAEHARSFAWEVGNGWVRWGYHLAGVGAGTELTETWEFTDAGLAMFEQRYGADAEAQIRDRAEQARTGIPATLAALKRLAEADARAEG